MQYSRNIDYLLPAMLYLGVHTYWWARSPKDMADELSLDERRLKAIFESFPVLFRKSKRVSTNKQHYYALQARYALREDGDTADPEETAYIKPVPTDQIELLVNFVMRRSEYEQSERRGWITNFVAVGAAVVAAASAIATAFLKH